MTQQTPKSQSEKNYAISKEVITSIKNLRLEGVEKLCVDKVITTFEVTRNINPKTKKPTYVMLKIPIDEKTETISFDLVEIEPEKLDDYRKSGIPSFVLKTDGKFYYCEIPNNLSFVSSSIVGSHKCAAVGSDCNRLSAAIDEKGGCAKVRDRYKCIENYPWITSGYETFNTNHDSFVVGHCLHFEQTPRRKHYSVAEINKARLSLAQFLFDEDL